MSNLNNQYAIVKDVDSSLTMRKTKSSDFIIGNFSGTQPINVAAVATTNQPLSTTKAGSIIDDHTLVEGDLVLLTAQTTANQRGIYVVGLNNLTIDPVSATKFELNEINTILVQNGTQNANTQYIQKTANVTFNGTTFSPSLTFQQIPTSYPINNVWYIAENGNDTTGNGTISKPYATFAKAQSMAGSNDTVVVFNGAYTENWTITKSLFINCGIDNEVKLTGSLSFSQTNPFYTVIQGLQVNGNVDNGINTGGWRMQECTINGDITIVGDITGNIVLENCQCPTGTVQVSTTNNVEVQIDSGYYNGSLVVDNTGSVVYVRNLLGLGTVTHSAGALLLLANIVGVKKDGSGNSINSTATNASPFNFIAIGSVSTQQADLTYGLINKTGNCPYVISAGCNISPTGNTLTGTQSLQTLADYVNANYTPTNYTPINNSVNGHLQGINAALGNTGAVATQSQTDNGYSTGLSVGVGQMKLYNAKNDFTPTIIGRPQANNSVSVSPIGRAAPMYDFYGIAWSSKLGLFAAVSSSSNKIVTSPDGITWTDQVSTAAQWRTICWSPELSIFVAVAQTGQINTSSNGITWTNRTSPAANGWSSICWSPEKSLFVVVAISGTQKVMTSPDGVTWTLRTPSSDTPLWYCITWANSLELFVVGGTAGNFMTSPDGITWTSVTQALNANTATSISWSPKLGLLVAGFSTEAAGNRILTSTNGTTWINRTVAGTAINGISWSPELEMFYAVGNDPSNPINTSFDGITWTSRSQISGNVNVWQNVCWSPELGIFCSIASGGTGASVMTSIPSNSITFGTQSQLNTSFTTSFAFNVDQFKKYNYISSYMPTIWGAPQGNFVASGAYTARTAPSALGYSEVCYSPELNLFVAVSGNGGSVGLARVATSNDAINWTSQNASNDSSWTSVCWSPQLNLFVAVSAGSLIMSSSDGVTWTNRNSTAGRTYSSVCWSPQQARFIAVATGSAYMRSNDGITWTSKSMPVNISWQSVCYSPELDIFVAVSGTGTGTNQVATLANGATTWVTRTSIAGFWQSVCWANKLGLFIAVASSGTNNIMTSPDGITWTARTASETFSAQYVLWCPEIGLLVSVGSVSTTTKGVMTSTDGITWTVRAIAPNTNTWLGACWAAPFGAIVAVSGVNATSSIMTSKSAHNAMTTF